jgi:hypothetical protein
VAGLPARPVTLLAAVVAALMLCACGGSSSSKSASAASTTAATSTSGELGFEGIPIEIGPSLASPATTGTRTVDRIHCAASEQLVYHIHSHLAVFVDGRLYSLPGGIGIPGSTVKPTQQGPFAFGGSCIYWLHTHAPDGIIHIESPVYRVYNLGQFFDEWRQPLSANQVASVHGKITAFFNGKLWRHPLRDIPLLPRAVIQFDIGQPAPPLMSVNWSGTGL